MASFDFDSIITTTLDGSKELGKTLFKNFADQAAADARDFVQFAREGIERATRLYAEKKIDAEDLEDLILGKKDLAVMNALKQKGLASAAIDTFTNGVLNILVNAIFTAVKF
jgi:hypothetical protein